MTGRKRPKKPPAEPELKANTQIETYQDRHDAADMFSRMLRAVRHQKELDAAREAEANGDRTKAGGDE